MTAAERAARRLWGPKNWRCGSRGYRRTPAPVCMLPKTTRYDPERGLGSGCDGHTEEADILSTTKKHPKRALPAGSWDRQKELDILREVESELRAIGVGEGEALTPIAKLLVRLAALRKAGRREGRPA